MNEAQRLDTERRAARRTDDLVDAIDRAGKLIATAIIQAHETDPYLISELDSEAWVNELFTELKGVGE